MLSNTLKVFLLGSGLFLISCTQESDNVNSPTTATSANPASTKCIADGYQLIASPSAINGVGLELRCYNPNTKRQCEEWDYYRGNCTLK